MTHGEWLKLPTEAGTAAQAKAAPVVDESAALRYQLASLRRIQQWLTIGTRLTEEGNAPPSAVRGLLYDIAREAHNALNHAPCPPEVRAGTPESE